MSRRCRASLFSGTEDDDLKGGGDVSSGCDCGRMGTPAEPCVEPLLYGTNVLLDPGFEQYPGVFGLNTGPDGETFPGEYGGVSSSGASQLFWADGSSVYLGPVPFWTVFSNDGVGNNPENRWDISNVNPRTGTFHARFATDDDFAGGFTTQNAALFPLSFYLCARSGKRPVTAIVKQGDLIVMTAHAMVNVVTDNPTIELAYDVSTQDGTVIFPGFSFPVTPLTTSYAEYKFGAFMPTGAYYMDVGFYAEASSGPTVKTIFDLDDTSLAILQAGQQILLCAFSTLLTIDNNTTETSFL